MAKQKSFQAGSAAPAAGPTANIFAGLFAVNAITSAFSSYEAGQMQKVAFDHQAAMAVLNARQQEAEAQFFIADKQSELANNLALQNVIAAASGRQSGVGSLANLTETSISNLTKDIKRIETVGETRKVATLMESSFSRLSGESAAKFGLLSGATELSSGLLQASRFIS